jgi:hypothetical protein
MFKEFFNMLIVDRDRKRPGKIMGGMFRKDKWGKMRTSGKYESL